MSGGDTRKPPFRPADHTGTGRIATPIVLALGRADAMRDKNLRAVAEQAGRDLSAFAGTIPVLRPERTQTTARLGEMSNGVHRSLRRGSKQARSAQRRSLGRLLFGWGRFFGRRLGLVALALLGVAVVIYLGFAVGDWLANSGPSMPAGDGLTDEPVL